MVVVIVSIIDYNKNKQLNMANTVTITQMKDVNGQPIAPLTPEEAIYDQNGVRLSQKMVNLMEHIPAELLKRIQGISEESSASTDPFKFLGEFSDPNANELHNALNGLHSRDKADGYEGVWRFNVQGKPSTLYNFALNYGVDKEENERWLQGLMSVYSPHTNPEYVFGLNGKINILYRIYENKKWSAWRSITQDNLDAIRTETVRAQLAEEDLRQALVTNKKSNYIHATSDEAYIISKYNNKYDIIVHFAKTLENELYTIESVYLVDNTNPDLSTNINRNPVYRFCQQQTSDMIGPLSVRTGTDGLSWVGGNHLYLDQNSGVKTAKTLAFVVNADDNAIGNGSMYADKITIRVKNEIYDPNVAPATGADILSSRLIEEFVTYTINKGEVLVSVEHKYAKDIYVATYYGMQSMFSQYSDIITNTFTDWRAKSESATSILKGGGIDFNRFSQRAKVGDNSYYYQNTILLPYGIGKHQLINDGGQVFVESGSKAYHVLIKNRDIKANEVLSWMGIYSWKTPIIDNEYNYIYSYSNKNTENMSVTAKQVYDKKIVPVSPSLVNKVYKSEGVVEVDDIVGYNIVLSASSAGSSIIKADEGVELVSDESDGLMSVEDKVALDDIKSAINIGEYQTIQAVWDACKQIALKNPEVSIIKYSVKQGRVYNRGIVFQSYHYNDAIVTQYYLYGGGQKHECNVRHIVTNGTTDEWQSLHIYTSFSFENGSLYGYKYGKSTSSTNKVEIVKIPEADLTRPGLLSLEGKSKLNNLATIGNSYDLDTYTNSGVYFIQTGSNEVKNYPIQTPANSVLRLTVLNSYDGHTVVNTQVVNINNHVGGEGNVYIRSQQDNEWKPWAKLQTNVEVGLIDQIQMDDLTDNGIYSGILSTTGETFVIICINNYAIAQQAGIHHISHLKYSLVVGTGEVKIEKRTRDAYGFWTDWESIGSGSSSEATTDTVGGVKLGKSTDGGWLPLGNIPDSYGSGLGLAIDSSVFYIQNNRCLTLSVGRGLERHGGSIQLKIGTTFPVGQANGVPIAMGTFRNNDELCDFTALNDTRMVPTIPVNPDQFKLGVYGLELKNSSNTKVTWDSNSNMNDFKTPGVYDIYGERTNLSDNLPILNSNPGHSIAARLTVVASTLQPANDEICITQFLMLSNRKGGDGNMYVRTYNENNSPFKNWWTPWQKQQGMVETIINSDTTTVGQEIFSEGSANKIGDGLNGMIDNGMYSGIYIDNLSYTGTSSIYYLSAQPTFVETFVLVVINDYAASGKLNLPRHITQLKYAVDAITGQSTVKKRVGTGSENISWGDWEDIGGSSEGGTKEVDITKAVKTDNLYTLVTQGFIKEGVTYKCSQQLDYVTNLKLDLNDKIVNHISTHGSIGATEVIFYINFEILGWTKHFLIDCYNDGIYYKYIINMYSNDSDDVRVSADMTIL